jgi:dimethylaniline monooxygenase (N-oxide forming)
LCAPKRVPDPVILPILGNKPDPSHLNVPVDSSSASLFDTAYVHPLLRDHTILWEYYDIFIKSTLWLVSGTKHGLDQWIGGISKQRYHASKSTSRGDD